MKIIVRHVLYIEDNGRLTPCGARLLRSTEAIPRCLIGDYGHIHFDFADPAAAAAAAVALEKYLAVQSKEKK